MTKIKDKEALLEALEDEGAAALENADGRLLADRDFVLEAVTINGLALEYADDSLKADRDFVLAAAKRSGFALKHADETLQADREVVLAAVKQDGPAFAYAGDSLKADREAILRALDDVTMLTKKAFARTLIEMEQLPELGAHRHPDSAENHREHGVIHCSTSLDLPYLPTLYTIPSLISPEPLFDPRRGLL